MQKINLYVHLLQKGETRFMLTMLYNSYEHLHRVGLNLKDMY